MVGRATGKVRGVRERDIWGGGGGLRQGRADSRRRGMMDSIFGTGCWVRL